jgi:hypothetical protein
MDLDAEITKLMRHIEDLGANMHLTSAQMALSRARDLVRVWMQGGKEPVGPILHFNPPRNPEVRFEWHSGTKRVYVIRVPADPAVTTVHADPIAYEIVDHGAAQNAVLIWMRGYNEGRCPKVEARPKPN